MSALGVRSRHAPATRWAAALPAMAVIIAALATACDSPPESSGRQPTRVILLIGDGAGVAHWSAAMLSRDTLAIRKLPVLGLVETSSESGPVTDSGASATAYSTGSRTTNRSVGMTPSSKALRSVFEVAAEAGRGRGIVATSSVVHATPAAFYAHVQDRYLYYDIAEQAAGAGLEVLLGGGRQFFDPTVRPDGRDLLALLATFGVFVETPEQLDAVRPETVSRLTGLFHADEMPPAPDRRPTLAAMTEKAIAVLDGDPDGFVLVVEGSQIDWRAHDNAPLEELVAEILDLDDAIRVAVAYADRTPGTLIVVITDHETGGLAVMPGDSGLIAGYTHASHSVELTPLFARGAGAERLGGIRRNDEIGRILIELVEGGPN